MQSFFSRCQPTRKEYIFLVEAEESLLFRWILSDQPSLPPRSSESFLCLCSFFRPSSTFRTKSVLLSSLGKGETPRGTEAPAVPSRRCLCPRHSPRYHRLHLHFSCTRSPSAIARYSGAGKILWVTRLGKPQNTNRARALSLVLHIRS